MGFEDRDYSRSNVPGGGLSQYSMITILIAINVIVFVLDMFTEAIRDSDGTVVGHELTKYLALSTHYWYLPWTWITHGFAHASIDSKIGFWHIGGNMLTLFFLGRPIEQRLGRWEFLKFYLMAILAAVLDSILQTCWRAGRCRQSSVPRAPFRASWLCSSFITRAKRC